MPSLLWFLLSVAVLAALVALWGCLGPDLTCRAVGHLVDRRKARRARIRGRVFVVCARCEAPVDLSEDRW